MITFQASTYRCLPTQTVSTVPVRLFDTDNNRKAVTVWNTGAVDALVYPSDSAQADAVPLPAGESIDFTPACLNALYAYTASGSTTIKVLEA